MSINDYPARLTKGYYRVRETWEEAASQLGAYRLLANAIAKADANPGYFVFADDGTKIYPEEESGLEEEVLSGEEEMTPSDETPAVDETGPDGTGEVTKPTEPDEPIEPEESTEETAGSENPGNTEEEGPAEPEDEKQEDAPTEPDVDEPENLFPEAVEYDYDGNDTPIAYAKLKTLMNIREGNSLDAAGITTYKKDMTVKVLQVCENGWLRIVCPESDTGFAYVNGDSQYIYGLGKKLYTVAAKDNLWKIAEEQTGSGTRYTEIRELNGLTCNVIRVGMALILP